MSNHFTHPRISQFHLLPDLPHKRQRRGFSLVELLVVITIVAILAALTVPGLRYVSTQANISKSTSNLRQIGATFQLYLLDNNYTYPKVANNPRGMWLQELWPYAHPQWAFPGWTELEGSIFYSPLTESKPEARSYGMNYPLQLANDTRLYGTLPYPAKTALVGDTLTTSSFKPPQVNYRNSGMVNVLFLDGHTSLLSPEEVPAEQATDPFWNGTID